MAAFLCPHCGVAPLLNYCLSADRIPLFLFNYNMYHMLCLARLQLGIPWFEPLDFLLLPVGGFGALRQVNTTTPIPHRSTLHTCYTRARSIFTNISPDAGGHLLPTDACSLPSRRRPVYYLFAPCCAPFCVTLFVWLRAISFATGGRGEGVWREAVPIPASGSDQVLFP